MTEEEVSLGLYRAANDDPLVSVVSWQGVNGKGYFAADVKIRLPDQRRVEPDLILTVDDLVWVIEIKDLHSQSVSDEIKLNTMVGLLGPEGVLDQIQLRSGISMRDKILILAVAFARDDVRGSHCVPGVVHIDWSKHEEAAQRSLSGLLANLRG